MSLAFDQLDSSLAQLQASLAEADAAVDARLAQDRRKCDELHGALLLAVGILERLGTDSLMKAGVMKASELALLERAMDLAERK